MTDDEIRQSRIDHYHLQQDIIMLVGSNTPSRIGRSLRKLGGRVFAYDYTRERYVEMK